METPTYKPLFTKANWIFFCRELIKTASGEESWLSKKRIMEWTAFIILQWGLVHWMILNVNDLSASELAIWAGLEMVICGYQLKQIQNEKKLDKAIDAGNIPTI